MTAVTQILSRIEHGDLAATELGVLRYELLTGTTPLDKERLRKAGFAEVQRIIRDEEPPKPSVRLSTAGERLTVIAKDRKIDPKRLHQLVRGELDWVVMKALDKDRSRRYSTASSFADDLDRFLAGDTVEACPPSTVYRWRKLVRRHRNLCGTAAVLSTALMLGIVTTSMQWRRAEREKAQTIAERGRAISAERERDEMLTEQIRLTKLANEESERRRHLLYIADMNAAQAAWERADVRRVEHLLNRHKPNEGDEQKDLRGVEWFILRNMCDDALSCTTSIPLGYGSRGLVVSPSDGKLVAGIQNNSVAIVDPATSEVKTFGPRNRTWVLSYVAFSSDGSGLVIPGSDTRNLQLLAYPSCERKFEMVGHRGEVFAVAISSDDRILVSGDSTGEIILWSMESGTLLNRVRHTTVRCRNLM